jgi:lipoate-protein ligase B
MLMSRQTKKKSAFLVDLGMMPYAHAWQIQQDIVAAKKEYAFPDVILMVEHPSVVTLGRGGKQGNLLVPPDELQRNNIDFFRVERGGDVTYHGPGQQVVYFIFSLDEAERDVSEFVFNLEETILLLLNDLGIRARRRRILQRGVFVEKRKIASVGVAVKDHITFHGFALNNTVDLASFRILNPCGIPGMKMTSIKEEIGRGCERHRMKELLLSSIEIVFNRVPEEMSLGDIMELTSPCYLGAAVS